MVIEVTESGVVDQELMRGLGQLRQQGYRIAIDDSEHVALVYGDLADLTTDEPVLTRVHAECLTGDVFGSSRCDCGPQLDEAMDELIPLSVSAPSGRC